MSIELTPIDMLNVLDPEKLKSRLLLFPSRREIAFNHQLLVDVVYIQTMPRAITCDQDRSISFPARFDEFWIYGLKSARAMGNECHRCSPTTKTDVVLDNSSVLKFHARSGDIRPWVES